jgi:chromate reductase
VDSTEIMSQDGTCNVAALVGSLRHDSYNRGLLRAAIELQPAGMRITEVPIGTLPLYNGDLEREGDPGPVLDLKAGILAADAVLIISPEYNQSISGVLKNALDWASRAYGEVRVLNGKPVAILGTSSGQYGTARAQLELRRILPYLGMYLLPKPEIYVGPNREFFDDQRNLTDDKIRDRMRDQLTRLMEWTTLLRSAG